MSHRALPTAVAVVLAASLLLTACGGSGDDDAKPADKVEGAEEAKSPSASPSPAEAGRPKIELPKDLKLVFEWKETGNAQKDAVLHDAEQRIRAVHLAITNQDAVDEAYRFYTEGEAAVGTQEWVQSFVDHKGRTTGVARYHRETLTLREDGTANLVYCEDQSKGYNKDIKTGEVDAQPATKNSYIVYNSVLRKNDDGIWVTEKLISEPGAESCQP